MLKKQTCAWFALFLTTVVWASSLVLAKIIYSEVSPILFVALRYTLALPFLLLILLAYNRSDLMVHKVTSYWKILMIVGITGPFLSQVLQYIGLGMTTASETLLLLNMSPVFALVLAAIILKESITHSKIYGLCLAFIGMSLIVHGGPTASLFVDTTRLIGDALVIISTFLFAINGVSGRIAVQNLDSVSVTFYSTLIGIPFMWTSVILTGSLFELFSMSIFSWFVMAWIAIVNTALAFILYYESMKYIEASLVQIGLSLIAVWGVILSILFLGEPLFLYQIVGGALTIIGVIVSQKN